MNHVQAENGDGIQELRAVRVTLVDERGGVRGVLGSMLDGSTGLMLYGADACTRVVLAADADGTTHLKLHDPEGEVAAWLAVGRDGDPSLYLHRTGRNGAGRRGHAELSVDEHGRPVLSLHDRDGRPRVLLSLDEQTGMASLSFADANGNSCLSLTEEATGGRILVFDPEGRLREVPEPPHAHQEPPPAETEPPDAPSELAATDEEEMEESRVLVFDRDESLDELPEDAPAPLAFPEEEPPAFTEPPPIAPKPTLPSVVVLGAPRSAGRLRRTAANAALVLLAALLGAIGAQFVPAFRPAPAATEPAAPPSPRTQALGPVIHAEELILTDPHGEVRARLGVLPDGTPLLWMTDPETKGTVELSVLSTAGALLRLSAGKSSVALNAPPSDPPSLAAYVGNDVLFQAPSHVARFLPFDLFPDAKREPAQ